MEGGRGRRPITTYVTTGSGLRRGGRRWWEGTQRWDCKEGGR